jgi:hypothetical protein
MSKFKNKTELICFSDIRGIICFGFVSEETTVNQAFYMHVLKRLIDAMRCEQGELWMDCSLILHHDNMPANSLLRVSQFLAQKGSFTKDHPLYSPNSAPTDFWMFKKKLK